MYTGTKHYALKYNILNSYITPNFFPTLLHLLVAWWPHILGLGVRPFSLGLGPGLLSLVHWEGEVQPGLNQPNPSLA